MKRAFFLMAMLSVLPSAPSLATTEIERPQVSQSNLVVARGGSVGTSTCEHIYRGQGRNSRPIQKATLESRADGYTLRFTEIIKEKPIETVWELDNGLVIEAARTGELPEGRWNLVPYNRQPPVTIRSRGAFSINMMVSSRSICTFTGTLQFIGNAQAQLFPGIAQNADKPVDPRSEATIAKLNPQAQLHVRELIRKSALSGIQIKVTSGLRTYKEQDTLYCQGRNIPYCNGLYKPGKIVTNAKGGYSNHNFGIAFDIGVFDGNKYLPESPKYNEVGKIGRDLGLEWGGDWKTIKDRPHFQLRPQWATNLSESKMLEELRRRTEKNEPFYP